MQFTHGVFLREKRSKAELWASVGPRLKTDVLSRATGKHGVSCRVTGDSLGNYTPNVAVFAHPTDATGTKGDFEG